MSIEKKVALLYNKNMGTLLNVEDLYMTYFGAYVGVDTVSFKMNDMEHFVIYGKTLSGKSSLLRTIAGLEEYKGKIEFFNVSEKVFSFDEKSLKKNDIVFNVLSYPLKIRKVTDFESVVLQQAKKYKIDSIINERIKNLNLEQKKIVLIARALIRSADIYLFDDVFKDIKERYDEIFNIFLKDIEGKSVIFATSNIAEAFRVSNVVSIMAYKKYLQRGTKEELLKLPKNREVLISLGIEDNMPSILTKKEDKYYLEDVEVVPPISNIYVGKEVTAVLFDGKIRNDVYFDKDTDYLISKW